MKDLRYASIVLDFRIPGSHSCTPGPLCEDTLLWMVACILLDSLGTNLEAIASIWKSLVTSCPLLGLFVRTHSTLVAPPGRRDGSGSWKKKMNVSFLSFFGTNLTSFCFCTSVWGLTFSVSTPGPWTLEKHRLLHRKCFWCGKHEVQLDVTNTVFELNAPCFLYIFVWIRLPYPSYLKPRCQLLSERGKASLRVGLLAIGPPWVKRGFLTAPALEPCFYKYMYDWAGCSSGSKAIRYFLFMLPTSFNCFCCTPPRQCKYTRGIGRAI